MAGLSNTEEDIQARQDRVEELMIDGFKPHEISKRLSIPERTLARDRKVILARWKKESEEESRDVRKKNLEEFNRRYFRERKHCVDMRQKMVEAGELGLVQKYESSIREWDKLYHDVNIKAGKFTNVPQEVVNTLQTGKQFVVEWKGKNGSGTNST